ncbi:MAG TPA: YicC/YloC family endoribonuclease [Longimicrobiales bacterium]|nr:YicC/YloC family endoribonuclease [Longimicrobiales bacterium]
MIRSMTGYGEAERQSAAGLLRIEVKTVNHRFFNANIKTPPGFDRYEPVIAEALKRHLARGHVSAHLSLGRPDGGPGPAIQVDLERARAYMGALETLREELGVPGAVDLTLLAHYGDIFRVPERDAAADEVEPDLVAELAEAAAAAVRAMREAEGERLAADLEARLEAIEREVAHVEARAPERLVEQHERLREAVCELTRQVEVDEERLAREIAYMAERWDVSEELVRLRSHAELFRAALGADGSEPVGKRLGFLAQEMHREANTIGSKANDAEIARATVSLKEEIERIREQVENVE